MNTMDKTRAAITKLAMSSLCETGHNVIPMRKNPCGFWVAKSGRRVWVGVAGINRITVEAATATGARFADAGAVARRLVAAGMSVTLCGQTMQHNL